MKNRCSRENREEGLCRRTFAPSRNERDYELAPCGWSFAGSLASVGLILLAYVNSSLFMGRKSKLMG